MRTIILIFRGELTGGAKESEIRGRYWPIVTDLPIAHHRLRNQRLTGPPFEKPEQVVRWLTAVQSQDYAGAKWAIAQRVKQVADDEIDKLFNAGRILRTHVMRPTWHFVTPADIRWLLMLTAPRVNAANGHYYRKLELDDTVFNRTNKAIAKALSGGRQLTRGALRAAVQRAGVATDHAADDLLRFNYILIRAELDGVICSGARQGKQFTYALLDERVPETKPRLRDQALADLTRRYFTSHGPATLPDFVWWSGLTAKDANSGLGMVQSHLLKEVIDGKAYWRSSSVPSAKRATRVAYLLPVFDEYLVSYKDRSAAFEANDSKETPGGNMMLGPVIVIGGRVVGSWKRSLEGNRVCITLNHFAAVSKSESQLVADAANRYGEFLGTTLVQRLGNTWILFV